MYKVTSGCVCNSYFPDGPGFVLLFCGILAKLISAMVAFKRFLLHIIIR